LAPDLFTSHFYVNRAILDRRDDCYPSFCYLIAQTVIAVRICSARTP